MWSSPWLVQELGSAVLSPGRHFHRLERDSRKTGLKRARTSLRPRIRSGPAAPGIPEPDPPYPGNVPRASRDPDPRFPTFGPPASHRTSRIPPPAPNQGPRPVTWSLPAIGAPKRTAGIPQPNGWRLCTASSDDSDESLGAINGPTWDRNGTVGAFGIRFGWHSG